MKKRTPQVGRDHLVRSQSYLYSSSSLFCKAFVYDCLSYICTRLPKSSRKIGLGINCFKLPFGEARSWKYRALSPSTIASRPALCCRVMKTTTFVTVCEGKPLSGCECLAVSVVGDKSCCVSRRDPALSRAYVVPPRNFKQIEPGPAIQDRTVYNIRTM